jgi:uncharacterized protein (TIGR03032 family)
MTPTLRPEDRVIRCVPSESFASWLAGVGGSLAITTYQANMVVLVGWDGSQVTVLPRAFLKPMGLAAQPGRLALAIQHEVVLLGDAPALAHDYLEDQPGRYDALFLPRVAYYTNDLNVHDLAFGTDELWVVATRFSCLATLSVEHNFVPHWKPPFVSQLVPEDRCHLNGLAMRDGQPAFVTALGVSDEVGGWRPGKADGGVVIDVPTGEVVLGGLSMPHSPRLHQGRLYVLNSGAGELWQVDPQTGKHEVVCALPAYLRGLGFAGDHALVGMCQIREKHIFGGLPVQQQHQRLLCGVAVVDLRSGAVEATLEMTSGCTELFEVRLLPGLSRPTILNRQREAALQAFTAPDFSYWLRPSNVRP